MRNPAVAKAYADITAAVAMLTGVVNEHGSGVLSAEGDPLPGLSEDCLDILIGAAAVDAQMAGVKAGAAVKYADIARAVAPPDASVQAQEMAVTAEVGCALTIGDRAAGSFLGVSHALTNTLPLTMAALQSGTISWQHARVMADEAATLDQAGAAALEAHFLDPDVPGSASGCPAGEMPASRFRHKARTWRERHHAESIEKRYAKGVLDRRVEYAPDQDGMAWLSAYLPAHQAVAIWNRTTAVARGLQGPDEPLTLTQLRADVFAATLLGNGNHGSNGSTEGSEPGRVPPPRAEVLVSVPVFSLLGATDEPAMLDGYGPIPASMARDVVANGADSFYRVLIDPRDGAPLEIGRSSYRLSKAMRQWLRLRDGKCPFPGCSNNSLDNEADHILAWAKGGTTGVSNLGQPCPKHHKLRHNGGWQPTPASKTEPPGWISPSGRRYTSEHQDWEPPHWPNQLKPQEALPDGYPDLVHIGLSLGEEGLKRLFHARA
ncbi:DUF222 domain-containing protein [Pseudarthrobacter psychrotolerans]|uniref:DUF222 domain-containing protein n=1 Tax=Pseudarthrobacter psychrotolerans TaxID=2697569 RepID=A0A6P1NLD1_9MICC|nr:HNH endonuclease signature motif containing protein [Pseudarthrobacter psychrotolerans]QHK19324.1 DUF222 domain-containing protein [Pseudarthrobacter psychrotolerans]